MKITIGHLFYDILNLYGESGNILALKYALEKQGIDVEVKEISLNDNLYLGDLDLVYMGAGTETNQILALEYLKKYLPHISQEVLSGKFFLVTGNAVELFGTHIQDGESKIETLGIFHYYTERTKERRVSECVFKHKKVDDLILGFENHQGILKNVSLPMFEVIKGYGEEKDTGTEGFKHNSFRGTYLLGPILARNPKLLEYFVKELISRKDKDFEFKPLDLEIAQAAHDRFMDKYTNLLAALAEKEDKKNTKDKKDNKK
ncbi:MAG: glutamine amidotransferase [Clostridia bacterium]|nr:glutamine amidotransferase [Clostridia bacterium]